MSARTILNPPLINEINGTIDGLTNGTGELSVLTVEIGKNSVINTGLLTIGNTSGTAFAIFAITPDAGNPLSISKAIKPTGLVDANGLTGGSGQVPVANGTGGFVWTTQVAVVPA
jgi:hypothetical protein